MILKKEGARVALYNRSEISLRIFRENKIPTIVVPSTAKKYEVLEQHAKEQIEITHRWRN